MSSGLIHIKESVKQTYLTDFRPIGDIISKNIFLPDAYAIFSLNYKSVLCRLNVNIKGKKYIKKRYLSEIVNNFTYVLFIRLYYYYVEVLLLYP